MRDEMKDLAIAALVAAHLPLAILCRVLDKYLYWFDHTFVEPARAERTRTRLRRI